MSLLNFLKIKDLECHVCFPLQFFESVFFAFLVLTKVFVPSFHEVKRSNHSDLFLSSFDKCFQWREKEFLLN